MCCCQNASATNISSWFPVEVGVAALCWLFALESGTLSFVLCQLLTQCGNRHVYFVNLSNHGYCFVKKKKRLNSNFMLNSLNFPGIALLLSRANSSVCFPENCALKEHWMDLIWICSNGVYFFLLSDDVFLLR